MLPVLRTSLSVSPPTALQPGRFAVLSFLYRALRSQARSTIQMHLVDKHREQGIQQLKILATTWETS